MNTIHIPNEQWSKIYTFVKSHPGANAGQEAKCRIFVEAILWIARSGAQWRLLPPEYGKWNSVYKRYARWCDNQVWIDMHQHFADDPDMENLLIDSTIVRAHPSAAGALKKTVVKPNKH
jgi:transposase